MRSVRQKWKPSSYVRRRTPAIRRGCRAGRPCTHGENEPLQAGAPLRHGVCGRRRGDRRPCRSAAADNRLPPGGTFTPAAGADVRRRRPVQGGSPRDPTAPAAAAANCAAAKPPPSRRRGVEDRGGRGSRRPRGHHRRLLLAPPPPPPPDRGGAAAAGRRAPLRSGRGDATNHCSLRSCYRPPNLLTRLTGGHPLIRREPGSGGILSNRRHCSRDGDGWGGYGLRAGGGTGAGWASASSSHPQLHRFMRVWETLDCRELHTHDVEDAQLQAFPSQHVHQPIPKQDTVRRALYYLKMQEWCSALYVLPENFTH